PGVAARRLELDEQVSRADSTACLTVHAAHRPGAGGAQRMDHLHGFHDDQQVPRRDPLTRRDLDGGDETRKPRDQISRLLPALASAACGTPRPTDARDPPMAPAARDPDVVAVKIDRATK